MSEAPSPKPAPGLLRPSVRDLGEPESGLRLLGVLLEPFPSCLGGSPRPYTHRGSAGPRWQAQVAPWRSSLLSAWTAGRSHGSASHTANQLDNFPVLNIDSGPPDLSAADWTLVVDGLVTTPLRLDRDAWLALPRTPETREFHCVEGWSVAAGLVGSACGGAVPAGWAAGAGPVRHLPRLRRRLPGQSYPGRGAGARRPARRHPGRRPLPPAHGGPLRLVVPTQLGYKYVKWVVRLEVTACGPRDTGRATAATRPRRRWGEAKRREQTPAPVAFPIGLLKNFKSSQLSECPRNRGWGFSRPTGFERRSNGLWANRTDRRRPQSHKVSRHHATILTITVEWPCRTSAIRGDQGAAIRRGT